MIKVALADRVIVAVVVIFFSFSLNEKRTGHFTIAPIYIN